MVFTFVEDILKRKMEGTAVNLDGLNVGYYFIRLPKHDFPYYPRIEKENLMATIQGLGWGGEEEIFISDANLSYAQPVGRSA